MGTVLEELRPSAIRDHVAAIIRRALMERRFLPGETLSEAVLAKQMKISRGPVREALLVLVQEGLAVHSQNRGFTVLELTPRDLADITQARIPMEAKALELARERATAGQISRIERLKEDLLDAFRPADWTRCGLLDLEFHTVIWEASGNPWLVHALKRIMAPYFTFTGIHHILSERLTEELMERQHRMYVDYLRGVSQHSAKECVEFHVDLSGAPGDFVHRGPQPRP
jgi:DNA-binding GntR family transcriptional regulator